MANTPQKGPRQPMSTPHNLDHLQQVHELNRAFLGLLQTRLREQRPCFELPLEARRTMHTAAGSLLDLVAAFPQALFRVETASQPRPALAELQAFYDEAEHDLCLSVLLAVRQTSRQSAYQARLLFGLEAMQLERFRTLALADLQRLACLPGVLRCAFKERQWFWQGLLTATRPELRRQLTLMALQPGIALDWPSRRPPQASA